MIKNIFFKNKKKYLILCIALLSLQAKAQKIEKFYNHKWKECKVNEAMYYSITQKIDSGYLYKDYLIREGKPLHSLVCKDSLCKMKNGEYVQFYPNGKLVTKGTFKLNKKEGTWLSYHYNGKMKDSVLYSYGNPIGKYLSWHPNGFQRDSIYYYADKSGVRVSWFDNGNPESFGRFTQGHKKSGKWNYFHKNGKISTIEIYSDSKLVDSKYYDENGIVMSTATKDAPAEFPKGNEAWVKYLFNYVHNFLPNGFDVVNTDKVTIVVDFTIDENGKTENIYICTPINDKIDSLVIKAIQDSPKWIPATNHNRKVKQNNILPFTFSNK